VTEERLGNFHSGVHVKKWRGTNLAVAKPHKKPLGRCECDMVAVDYALSQIAALTMVDWKMQHAAVGMYTSYSYRLFCVGCRDFVPP
jgi:hypothetical protein